MSNKALPFLFINLGGEMVYILHQRLNAQNIDGSKAQKVLNDIIGTMYNKRFIDEIFKSQELHSKKAMRTVFDRLAHASIMRLNAASMDKLYDLMTMAVKYQVCLIPRPRDLLLITLNHLDGLRAMVENQTSVLNTLDYLYSCLIQTYGNMSDGELQLIRQSLMSFFQDMHVRVSIFLKEKQQNQNGRFVIPTGGPVPHGSSVPGQIVLYDQKGKVRQSKQFNPGSSYSEALPAGSFDVRGTRSTRLGTNMYLTTKPAETITSGGPKSAAKKPNPPSFQPENNVPDPLAKAQLDLLSRLINAGSAPQPNFRLNLFNTDEEEESYVSPVAQMDKDSTEYLDIDARKREKNQYLDKVMNDMSIGGESKDLDLLGLMDEA